MSFNTYIDLFTSTKIRIYNSSIMPPNSSCYPFVIIPSLTPNPWHSKTPIVKTLGF